MNLVTEIQRFSSMICAASRSVRQFSLVTNPEHNNLALVLNTLTHDGRNQTGVRPFFLLTLLCTESGISEIDPFSTTSWVCLSLWTENTQLQGATSSNALTVNTHKHSGERESECAVRCHAKCHNQTGAPITVGALCEIF